MTAPTHLSTRPKQGSSLSPELQVREGRKEGRKERHVALPDGRRTTAEEEQSIVHRFGLILARTSVSQARSGREGRKGHAGERVFG
jgi:hypothetical protein